MGKKKEKIPQMKKSARETMRLMVQDEYKVTTWATGDQVLSHTLDNSVIVGDCWSDFLNIETFR